MNQFAEPPVSTAVVLLHVYSVIHRLIYCRGRVTLSNSIESCMLHCWGIATKFIVLCLCNESLGQSLEWQSLCLYEERELWLHMFGLVSSRLQFYFNDTLSKVLGVILSVGYWMDVKHVCPWLLCVLGWVHMCCRQAAASPPLASTMLSLYSPLSTLLTPGVFGLTFLINCSV